jgi:DNA-binding MarR family transcriptional regulator
MVMIAIIHLPKGEASLNAIARKMGTTKQSVKQLVALLENRGYLVTAPSLRDKRAVNVALTPLGDQALIAGGELGLKFFTDLFHDFTPQEMETLWGLLKKLYRFDGEEQDGFEEEIHYQPSEGEH